MTITKKNNHIFVYFILLFFLQWLYASEDINKNYPIGICIIPEMEYIPDIDGCAFKKGQIDTTDKIKAITSFKKYMPWVQNLITPELVKSISKYAAKEMISYNNKPSLDSTCFLPRRISNDGFKILFEGVVDTLPTHSKIVTRWLKVYFLYDKATSSIVGVTITIRGQLLE